MKKNSFDSKKIAFKFHYDGKLGWLIFFALVCFPVAIISLLKVGSYQNKNTIYCFQYNGSWSWIYFWSIVFFPVIFVLFSVKGSALMKQKLEEDPAGDTVAREKTNTPKGIRKLAEKD
jgi:hypothetical protein